jgi:bile acid:Na+ symporter, BASS family
VDQKQLVILALQVSIVSIVFSFGLRSTTDDLLYLVRRPGLLLRSWLAVLVIMPVLAVALTPLFNLRNTVEVALIALAISPMPPLLPKKEAKAGGRQSYALSLMATMAVLAIVAVPLAVGILALYFGRAFDMSPGAIARIVLVTVLLPLLAGLAVRAVLPGLAERLARLLGLAAMVLLVLALLALLTAAWPAVWAAVGDGTIVALVAFVMVGLVVGHLLGGPNPDHSVVLALSTATRHPAIALSIASTNFPDERFVGTILLYLLVATIASIPYIAWQRRLVRASQGLAILAAVFSIPGVLPSS